VCVVLVSDSCLWLIHARLRIDYVGCGFQLVVGFNGFWCGFYDVSYCDVGFWVLLLG